MLLGFDSVKSMLLKNCREGKLHHATLLHGKNGTGKASFVLELISEIFDSKMASHPDILTIKKDEDKREITVDKVRKVADFVNQTPAMAPYKFIIVDSVCSLNKSAANAMLKVIEEPHPGNFFFLICHNLGTVLPTILSRCQIVKIPDISYQNFAEILRQECANITDDEIKFLAEICDKSVSDAIAMREDMSRFYQLFLRSILNQNISEELLENLSDKAFPFAIFTKVLEFLMSRLHQVLSGAKVDLIFEETAVFDKILNKFPPKKFFVIAEESIKRAHSVAPLYLDKKLAFINIFNQLAI